MSGKVTMRKLIESSFVSLDGIVTVEKLAPHWGAEGRAWALAELDKFDAFLFGRVTYEAFAPRWSEVQGDPYMDRINRMPKHVASSTLRDEQMTWGATLLKGDVAAEIEKLKQQPGKDLIKYGTGDLDRLLVAHQLIDEFHFAIFPLVLGQGRRAFEGCNLENVSLKLTNTTTMSNGIVRVTYVPSYR
jgi:dihydrofolate reductase